MPNGKHDRRGFDGLLKFHLVLALLSIVLLFVNWRIGLVLFFYAAIAFITCEVLSAPPPNNPEVFERWLKYRQGDRKTTLLCLGDSLTHGTVSADPSGHIPNELSKALGLNHDVTGQRLFYDPIWVVNAAQNSITSHTILRERLKYTVLTTDPDYVLIMIGTNDVMAMYKDKFTKRMVKINKLTEMPSLEVFEKNLRGILDGLHKLSPMTKVGVATLPPLGQDLKSKANQLIRQANDVIMNVVGNAPQGTRAAVVSVYQRFESAMEKESKLAKGTNVDNYFFNMVWMACFVHVPPFGITWNAVSSLVGNKYTTDGLHLNERGRDLVVAAVVDWLVQAGVTKTITLKTNLVDKNE